MRALRRPPVAIRDRHTAPQFHKFLPDRTLSSEQRCVTIFITSYLQNFYCVSIIHYDLPRVRLSSERTISIAEHGESQKLLIGLGNLSYKRPPSAYL